MIVDSLFSLAIEEIDGQKALRFFASEGAILGETATPLFAADLGELCDLAGVRAEVRDRFARARDRTIFSNGWQSWCYAGELASDEWVARARIVPNINVYTDGPGPREARDEVLSHFLTYIRAGEARLVLASKGSVEKATPPIAFRLDRSTLAVRAEIEAEGASLEDGQLVAEIRLFYREGYFEAKNALREVFREYGHFARLAFLGAGSSLVPGGYESWYNHYTDIDDGILERDLESIDANDNLINSYYLRRGKPTIFQIDDGWEKAVGDWLPDSAKFPRGMKSLAREIEDKGMIPGIWIAPLLATRGSAMFRERPELLLRDTAGKLVPAGYNPGWDGNFYCLDISLPEVEDYLGGVFRTIIEDWGYRYIKLDFLYAGFLRGARAEPGIRLISGTGSKPGAAYEHYDRLMRRLTSTIVSPDGKGIAYLGCGAPLEPSFRHFPLLRIGADTKERWEDGLLKYVVRHQGRPAAYTNLSHSIGRSILDGTVFVNDPDVVFCRTKRMKLAESEKELVALVGFLLASQVMFSDDASDFGDPAEVAFTSRIVGLYDRLAGGDYGAQRVSRDVYSIFSADGLVRGLANLSNRAWAQSGWDAEKAFLLRASRIDGSLAFAPRSISLFEG